MNLMKKLLASSLSLLIPLVLMSQKPLIQRRAQSDLDSTAITAVSYNYIYCVNNDRIIENARKQKIGIIYPTLVINGVVIRDSSTINVVRNNYDRGVRLGRYHIAREHYYTREKAERRGFRNISDDGVYVIKLRCGEVFDIEGI